MVEKKEIVYIISLGHSGSTLLGNILGSNEAALHIGEFIAPLERKIEILCQTCNGNPCPVWGGALNETYVKKVYNSYHTQTRKSKIKRLFNQPKNLYEPLTKEFQDLKFIIDSSKNISWTNYNIGSFKSYNYKIVFLFRDLRAVWASLARKYSGKNNKEELISLKRNIASLLDYQKTMSKISCSIYYERLVDDPAKELLALTNFLGVEYQDQMLQFFNYEHHTLGSNRNTLLINKTANVNNKKHVQNMNPSDLKYYNNINNGFKKDERWKSELSVEDLKLFEEILGETHKRIGYQ